jgi:cytochrome P450
VTKVRGMSKPANAPIPAEQCPHLGREYNHFQGPHLENPYPFFKRLREEAPITFNPTLGMWLVSRHSDIIEVLEDTERFSSADAVELGQNLTPEARAILGPGPLVAATPINVDPPAHTRLRRFLQPQFVPPKIARIEPRVRQLANALIDTFIHERRANLVERFFFPFPLQALLTLMGVPLEDMMRIKRWTADFFGLCFAQVPPEAQPAMARGVVEFRAYCRDLVEQRRRQPQDDLISGMVHTQAEGEPLKEEEFHSLIVSLLGGGHESTAAQLTFLVKHLLLEPERWHKVRENRALIPKFIEEGMRLEGVLAGLIRTVTRDVELGGVLLPKGARLFVLHSSGNHDETQFKDPERFDPGRDNLLHLTFSRGIHFCAGAPFARMELRVALEQLLERLPDLRLVPGQDYGYHQELVTLRSARHLHAEW